MFAYYKLNQVEQTSFYQLPKKLFSDEFSALDLGAKVMYSMLRDRMQLSMKNNWVDENGYVYIIYSAESLEKDLSVSHGTVSKLFSQLIHFGLVEKKRRGFGMPDIIYVKSFSSDDSSDGSRQNIPENEQISDESDNSPNENAENLTVIQNLDVKTSKIQMTGQPNFSTREIHILDANNNKKNKTDSSILNGNSKSSSSHIGREEEDVRDTEIIKNAILKEVQFDYIEKMNEKVKSHNTKTGGHAPITNVDLVKAIVDVVVRFVSSNSSRPVVIDGIDYSHGEVSDALLSLSRWAYINVASILEERTDIKNRSKFIITCLFNAYVSTPEYRLEKKIAE